MSTPETTAAPVRVAPWPRWPEHGEPERRRLAEVLDGGMWNGIDAPAVTAFEREFAERLATRHVITCANGTVSLEIALAALGIGAGDEVIVPPYTFLATASAVLGLNALPVFADITPDTYCIDPAAVEAAIGPRTRAVIAVHLAGHPADLDALGEICTRHGIALIEDAAHAHGSSWRDRPVGGFGAFGSWSFQGSKNLTSGEGGALSANDDELAGIARELRNCGRVEGGAWYDHQRFGGNWRITAFQAALLSAGLERLPAQFARREACAARLDAELSDVDGIRPLARDPRATGHAHHLYLFRYSPSAFGGRSVEEFCAALRRHGIPASRGYPLPLYRQPVFARQRFDLLATGWDPGHPPTRYDRIDLPVCERACAESVWLPHHVLLAEPDEMADVATAIRTVATTSS
ncbi:MULTISPECIES: DegT/DnrJ/EryC1/StrS family aminotransferase [Amycolatopsis methanolica group]|uniref:Glutamine--scyllo-inositol transaminase n=1 Tax=Amycolatopsis methanolica 239 TaxID=1068978 RepID=A0A076MYH8_AMYME|nr:DegT/DnrJ/EryC1/StrS family aminotransferase [Amycolatopsis methanolica]AIJ26229.1 glutamine--scyllo-inositol transaminase [Amycolatopsis methanolica 239]